MVAASASQTLASLTLFNTSCFNSLFSLCLNPSPTSNCTANRATQLPNTSPFSHLCISTSRFTKSASNIASIASFLPKYPISNTQLTATARMETSSEVKNPTSFGIMSPETISSTIGLLIDLISVHKICIDRTDANEINAHTVFDIKT
ncbi:hypothetical protein HanIR_Chr12g0564991 [Helianthus annuus]|nr:hypothetical protein HanIR_Chr12g0564991 [Helianthus annuus]